MPERLTDAQMRSLRWLAEALDGEGVIGYEASALIDGQPWIHWRTAFSLQARKLVETEWYGGDDGYGVRILDAGRQVLSESEAR